MNGNFFGHRALRAIAAAVCAGGAGASAQVNGSWASLSSGSWSVAANWTSQPLFPSGGGVATVGVSNVAVTLDVPISLQRVVFDGARGSSIFSPINVGTGSITLVGPAVVESTLNLPQIGTVSTAAGPSISSLYGSNGLTKTGPGMLTLNGGAYTGGTYINQGTLAAGADVFGAAGGSIVLNGGVLARTSSGTLNRDITVTPAGGAVYLGFEGGSDLFLNGPISGPGVFSFLGGGSLYLSADSPLAGTFRVGSSLGKAYLRQTGALRSVGTVALSGTLSLVNGATFNSNRISDSANLLLRNGVLQLESSIGVTERIGTITVDRGASYLTGSGTIAASAMVRNDRAVLFTESTGVRLDTAPQLVGGGGLPGSTTMSIVPWVNSRGLVTYQGGQLTGAPTRKDLPVGSVTAENVGLGSGSYFLAAPTTINALKIDSQSFPSAVVSGSSTLTINSGVIANISGGNTVTVPIDFGSAEGMIHIYGGALTIVGPISGSGGLTVSSRAGESANLFLGGANTYTGTTTFNGGTVLLSQDILPNTPGPLGSDSSPVVLNDAATLSVATVPSITFGRDLVIRSEPEDCTTRFPTTSGKINFTGDVRVEGIFQPSSATFSGSISGPGQIRIPSNATVSFSGDSSFTGDLWNSGTLLIGSDTALGTGRIISSPMKSGSFAVSTLTAANGPRSLANPFLIGNLVIGAAFPTTLTGPVQLNGGVTTLSLAAGTPQATISGPISRGQLYFNGGRLFLGGSNSQYATTINNGTVTIFTSNALGGGSGTPPLLTSVGTLGTLEMLGSVIVPPHPLQIASGSIGLHSIFGNSTWSGDVIRTANMLRIAVDADALTIGGKFDLNSGSFEKLGSGSLVVGNLRTSGAAIISAGRIVVRSNGTDTGVSNVASLSIAGGTSPTARLDLTNNDLVIDYAGISPIDTVRAQIASGRAAGSWNGNGITTSIANATMRGLGFAENATLGLSSFRGQPVDGTSLIIHQTFYGDANLDGRVDITDLASLATNWQASGFWLNGDFDYSGFIDISDLAKLAANWQAGVGAPAPISFEQALASVGLGGVVAPEPGCVLGLLAVAAVHHRRRFMR